MIESSGIAISFNFEDLMLLWLQYSGIIALTILILFFILYLKNKRKENIVTKAKIYKIIMIISIIIIVLDIVLWGIELYSISHIFDNVKDIDVSNLII